MKPKLDYEHMMILFENACRDFLKDKENQIVDKAIELLEERMGQISVAAIYKAIEKVDWEGVWKEALHSMEFDIILQSALREVFADLIKKEVKKMKRTLPEIVKTEIKVIKNKRR